MTHPTNAASAPAGLLGRLPAHDRERLAQAMRCLLSHGSILGQEPTAADLYHWCRQYREWLDEMAGLLDLELHWDHHDRTIQAIPRTNAFLLRLRLDASLVLMTLWYEFDTAVRDRGEAPPIRLTAQQLNDSLGAKFEPLRKHLPSPTRLREILALAQRKNLVRFTPDVALERSLIEILPTLKRVIPFQDIEEWTRNSERYLASAREPAPAATASGTDAESNSESEEATE